MLKPQSVVEGVVAGFLVTFAAVALRKGSGKGSEGEACRGRRGRAALCPSILIFFFCELQSDQQLPPHHHHVVPSLLL